MTVIPPSRQELCDELDRLLASKTFSAALRSRQLIEYFVTQLQLGTANELKEYSIAMDVFNRSPSYDPKLDTIVRTEVWRLRSRLSLYYGTEGKDNPLRVGFRPRSLVPTVQYRFSKMQSGNRPSAMRLLQRVAVMPFINIGDDDRGLSEGLVTDLIVRLGANRAVQVISRTSSFAFHGESRSARDIAAALEAHLLVEGTVQVRGRDLRVTALLTDGQDGTHIGSFTSERTIAPSLRMQQELAREIAADIEAKLVRRTSELVSGKGRGAYLDALIRMYFQCKYTTGATTELAESIKFFQTAAESQPGSQTIWRALSISAGIFSALVGPIGSDIMPLLVARAASPSDYDEMLAEARVCAGMVAMFRGEFDAATEMLARAAELHPADPMVHLASGILLLHSGRLEEALEAMRVGQRLDPLSALNAGMLALVLFNLRHMDEAREQADLCLVLDPENMMAQLLLADIDLISGQHKAALDKYFGFHRMSNGHPSALGRLGYIYGLEGRHADAQGVLSNLLSQAAEPALVAPSLALTYLGLGDANKALSWSQTAAQHNSLIDMMPNMPFYDNLRSDPKFAALTSAIR